MFNKNSHAHKVVTHFSGATVTTRQVAAYLSTSRHQHTNGQSCYVARKVLRQLLAAGAAALISRGPRGGLDTATWQIA